MRKPENLAILYIYLAIASGMLGVVITFIVIFACQYFGIDISQNLWVLAIPVTLAAFINVLLVELYLRRKRK